MSAPNTPDERRPHATPLKAPDSRGDCLPVGDRRQQADPERDQIQDRHSQHRPVATALRVAVLIRSAITIPSVEAAPTTIVIAISVTVNVPVTLGGTTGAYLHGQVAEACIPRGGDCRVIAPSHPVAPREFKRGLAALHG